MMNFKKTETFQYKLFHNYSKTIEKWIEKYKKGRSDIFNNTDWYGNEKAAEIYSKSIKKYTEMFLEKVNKSKSISDKIKDEFILYLINTDPVTYNQMKGKSIKKFLHRKFS